MAASEPQSPSSAPNSWSIFKQLPGMVLGFHGCDRETAEDVLLQRVPHLAQSSNSHDWLGRGIYFWEADPWRALEWAIASQAKPAQTKGKIKEPYVIGAVLDLGRCCNLLDYDTVTELARAHEFIKTLYSVAGTELPKNTGGDDKFMRHLDKLVIDALHKLREMESLPGYQTVRAAFVEGEKLYEGAGFQRKNHIQIAVLDPTCIKAYFRLPC